MMTTMGGANAPPAEDDANSGVSYEDGEASSADETAHNTASESNNPKKRQRQKYQKTS
jgi:hypothetical protein